MKKGEDLSLINFLLEKATHSHEPYYDLYTDSDRDYIAFNQLKRDIEKKKDCLSLALSTISVPAKTMYSKN